MIIKQLKNNNQAQKAIIVAVGLSLSFALMGVWIRMMQGSFDTFQQTYLRILLAGIMALFLFRKKFSKNLLTSISRREWGIYAVRSIVAYTIGVAGFTVAIENTSLATVSFVSALPLLGLLAWVLFREVLPLKSLIPITISLAGLFFMTNIDIHHFSFGLGEVAAIIATLGFDLGYLMSRLHKKERSNFENTTILLLLGWIPIFVLSLIRHESFTHHSISLIGIIGLILSSLANIVGLYAVNYVFTNLKAYIAGNILLLEGVFSLILGLVFYGEPVTLGIIFGGALIVASAIVINSMTKDDKEAEAPLLDDSTED